MIQGGLKRQEDGFEPDYFIKSICGVIRSKIRSSQVIQGKLKLQEDNFEFSALGFEIGSLDKLNRRRESVN